MTREEQIFEYLKERNIPITSLEANSIIEGIEWADEHPDSKRTYTKQQLIEKACQWWEQVEGNYDLYDAWNGDYVSFKSVIMDFREAMKG